MSDTLPVPLLAVRGLTIRFRGEDGPVDAVKGIDFDLYPSEILAIVGESGSGKSATALSIPGLLPGDAETGGAVLFDGENLLEEDAGALAELRGGRIAMIFQDPAAALDPVFSIGHQIGEALKLHEPALPAAQRRARALELLTQVGLDRPETRMGRYPHEFSGGQLQRIMIAMALAGRPELLIADEPTTALDVTVQQDILDLLYRLNRDEGMAILLITHDMGVVADIASRVIVLHHGRVVETATVGDLFDAPKEAYTQRLLAAVPNGEAGAGLPVNDTPPLLEVRDLHLGYSSGFGRRTEVVKGVSFGIGAGEFLGLVGESGSGKTTIGRSLIGLVKPLQGHIRLAGQDVHRGKALSGRIGAVFQNPAGSLNPRLTISRSIAEPILAHGSVPRGELQSRVDALLESVGIPAAWRHRYPSELSGGQRQRVAIARALALDPVLLVADEPTSALDVSVQDDILKLLRRLQQERQFACLFISHDLAVVRGLCRNVVVLHRGEVVEAGPSTTVLDTPATDYTRRLVTSAPLPDPAIQTRRRQARTGMFPADFAAGVRPAALKETVTTSV